MTVFDLEESSVRRLNQALHDATSGSFVVDNPRGAHAVAVGIDAEGFFALLTERLTRP